MEEAANFWYKIRFRLKFVLIKCDTNIILNDIKSDWVKL